MTLLFYVFFVPHMSIVSIITITSNIIIYATLKNIKLCSEFNMLLHKFHFQFMGRLMDTTSQAARVVAAVKYRGTEIILWLTSGVAVWPKRCACCCGISEVHRYRETPG